MYRLVKVEDVVRIPPSKFGEDLVKTASEVLSEKYVGSLHPDLGLILAITDIDVEPEGTIVPGDGATYHRAVLELLTFYPVVNEVVDGVVVDVKRIGVFVNIGPMDALVHISQIADDRMVYHEETGVLEGEETKLRISKGDVVRGRITAVSIARPSMIRIALTMRQPGLGKIASGGSGE
ncbi:MAG: DNA-directed RNA polymerase [Sulfolobales archaeon]|nr:DNA-directed RNA polymerase [Sulfolobales archaeon]